MGRLLSPMVKRGRKTRVGRGFSLGELKEAGITPDEARRLGVPVDSRRRSTHPENVEMLREWIARAREEGIRAPKPRQEAKPPRGRVYRGLTSAGKKVRGLRKSRGFRGLP
ncbi:MAG: 50S ribosomal protein L13 [Candidatus Bathyarchaeota archaeon B23]|nr:MAG: 50S ribosomal protein L13 [Candidatus Bathyarchaeota archaeon B23]